MFQVANCVACHKLNGVGNEIGPDLTKLDPKMTAERRSSGTSSNRRPKINEKYQTYIFETETGKVVTGLVLEETPEEVKVIENPLAKAEPVVLKKSEIVERAKSPRSIMPKGLLDKLTREEILDLVAYVAARATSTTRCSRAADTHMPMGRATESGSVRHRPIPASEWSRSRLAEGGDRSSSGIPGAVAAVACMPRWGLCSAGCGENVAIAEGRAAHSAPPWFRHRLGPGFLPVRTSMMTRRLLLVEDSSTMRRMISAMLQDEGYEVARPSTAATASIKARATPPELILTDYEMPELDGPGFCQALKADPELRSIPVIMLTTLGGRPRARSSASTPAPTTTSRSPSRPRRSRNSSPGSVPSSGSPTSGASCAERNRQLEAAQVEARTSS